MIPQIYFMESFKKAASIKLISSEEVIEVCIDLNTTLVFCSSLEDRSICGGIGEESWRPAWTL